MTPSSMRVIFIAVVLPLAQRSHSPIVERQELDTPWRTNAHAGALAFDTAGTLAAPTGVSLSVRSNSDLAPMTVAKSLAADTMGLRIVRLSGHLRTRDVTRFASIWVEVGSKSGVLIRDRGRNRTSTGTTEWKKFDVDVSIPRSATRIEFGVVISGTGTADVEGLTLSPVRTIDPQAPIGQKPAKLLDSVITMARKHSLCRDTVSWNTLLPEVREIAAGAKEEADVYPAIGFLVTRLGDRHSSFVPPRTAINRTPNAKPTVQLFENNVGYVNVAGFLGGNLSEVRTYATTVHGRLNATKPAATCGWIVDLRDNTGGNYGPMIAALRPFLGDQTLGYFVNRSSAAVWSAKLVSEAMGIPRHARGLDDLQTQPVAVLTGPRTGSSGELMTIAFRGRARTRSFGLPTAGLSTANSEFALPGGGTLSLTTATDADRNSVRYGNTVRPDSLFEVSAAELSGGVDPVQAAAVTWLRGESKCQ